MSDDVDHIEVDDGLEDEAGFNPNTIFNLGKAVVMVVDDNAFSQKLTCQALLGFGVKVRHKCSSAEEAMKLLEVSTIDLLIVDCDMPGMDGYDLVKWLRHSDLENAWVPIMMMSGHTRADKVTDARDCGANFILARPLAPSVFLERILWVARDTRRMLKAGGYHGPDRRFQEWGPPEGTPERRGDVLRAQEAAAAAEPTQDQSAAGSSMS